jgi:hypothetical protein
MAEKKKPVRKPLAKKGMKKTKGGLIIVVCNQPTQQRAAVATQLLGSDEY